MADGTILGNKTIFKRETVAIGNVTSLDGLSFGGEPVETELLNQADGFKTFIAGMKVNGLVTVTLNILPVNLGGTPADEGLLFEDAQDFALVTYSFVFPTTEEIGWPDCAPGVFTITEITDEGKLMGTYTFQPNGKPTFTPAP